VSKKIYALFAAVLLCAGPALSKQGAPVPPKAQPAPSPAERAAWACFAVRDWKGMSDLLQSGQQLSPRALSLAANALWYQKKYAESLELMDRVGAAYPKTVAPYAALLRALALERTQRPKEAYEAALAIWQDKSTPALAKYYAMYALSRLAGSVDEKEKWLRRMMAATADKARKASAARELGRIDRLTPADANELLRLQPQNAAALKVMEKAPDSAQKNYRLGYAAHLRGDHKTAVKYLSRLKLNEYFGESGTYYLCVSLQRLDRSVEAEPLLERLVLKKGSGYVARGMNRLRLMIGGKASVKALAALQSMSKSKDPAIAKQAQYTLAVSSWVNAASARDEYLKRFPSGDRANMLRWTRGWAKYRAGDRKGALDDWKGAGDTSPQLLYWRSRLHEEQGDAKTAEDLRKTLLEKHALSVYSFLAKPEGSLEVIDAPLPKELTPAPQTALERWGFMTHAYMQLEDASGLPERMRRVKIAEWLGYDWQLYRDLHGVAEGFMKGTRVPRKLLEYIYPRPFRSTVEEAAKKYGVDPHYIWSIMKQESGFNPSVSSWVGAAGLMQLMPATAASEAKRMKLKKYSLYGVHDNIHMGAHHIAGLMAAYPHLEWVAAAYNAGGGNVNKWNRERGDWEMDAWMEGVPFRETNGYVKNVMRNYAVYQKLYGKTDMKKFTPAPPASDDIAPDPAAGTPADGAAS